MKLITKPRLNCFSKHRKYCVSFPACFKCWGVSESALVKSALFILNTLSEVKVCMEIFVCVTHPFVALIAKCVFHESC